MSEAKCCVDINQFSKFLNAFTFKSFDFDLSFQARKQAIVFEI